MSQKDTLGDRQKGYEKAQAIRLTGRTPVIIRLDGKAFHTYTKRLPDIDPSLKQSPFSDIMHYCMTATAVALCKQVQNCQLAYTQSDEITLLLTDWDTLDTQQWFGGQVQKMVSIAASIASVTFNDRIKACTTAEMPLALFDARVFTLPKEEVTNNFLWRQQDATRNSLQMLARFYFSHTQLQDKNTAQMHDMLMLQYGVNWNDIPTWQRRGTCIKRDEEGVWTVDEEIPIFSADRTYINALLADGQE